MEGSQGGNSLLDNNGAFLRNWFPCSKAKVLLKSTNKKTNFKCIGINS